MPGYIKLCMKTWKVPFTVLNYENLHEYTDAQIEPVKRFTLPQIADYVRVHVLRDQGGYWLDADTVMISDELPNVTIFGDANARTNTIGMLHTEPHSDMFEQWACYQDEVVKGNGATTHWAIMGNIFTDPYLLKHREIEIGPIEKCWPETYMINDNSNRFTKYRKFYFEENYHLSDINQTSMLMLHNSWTPEWYKRLSEREALETHCTLSNILRELV